MKSHETQPTPIQPHKIITIQSTVHTSDLVLVVLVQGVTWMAVRLGGRLVQHGIAYKNTERQSHTVIYAKMH